MIPHPVNKVIVLGGGSAGFMAAIALKVKLPALQVLVIRSKDIGIIGVGEGSTVPLTKFLHEYLQVGQKKFLEVAQPTWKLGLRFIWGPPQRPRFFYTFSPQQPNHVPPELPRPMAFYCWDDPDYDLPCALMAQDKAFERSPAGAPIFPNLAYAYHFENEKFVQFLEAYATAQGAQILDDTVAHVNQDSAGVTGLLLASGRTESADLYVDASGFASLLLGKTLHEPFENFNSTLFCDRAVVGGWDRSADEQIRPYTTCETMDSGWAWQIEHENRVNRGYVYSSSFISDETAQQEFRLKNPKLGPTRIVKFATGSYQRSWVKNVVAIGNASGFVEPLEATALGVIAMQSRLLADTLLDTNRLPTPSQISGYNDYHRLNWAAIRAFIAVHYKFNTRLDTDFWRACREKVELTEMAQRIVDYYRENGPSRMWEPTLIHSLDQFGLGGYYALLLGQQVPHQRQYTPSDRELKIWTDRQRKLKQIADAALTVKQTLETIRSPRWKWMTT
ncbi:MAG TPA: tryptophan halogenase family protein [Tepidisphaeraceae bacterium]|jgi:tryptophan halogenase|nr:tryptophan halogenase family protein [Tepidisphaeraceae bacterium]